jgi:oligopeptide transport system ATP-binding protein
VLPKIDYNLRFRTLGVKGLENGVLLKVRNLKKYFPVRGGVFSKVIGYVQAVDGVSFDIKRGETLGLVGESGCGKTTAGRTILRLLEPTAGEVIFEGENIFKLDQEKLRKTRRNVQIIFQDPFGSLNPRMTVGDIVGESLLIHRIANDKKEKEKRVRDLLETVGLNAGHVRRYPHEFSGGQRQRIGIARALALNPKLIVCDEPVSALDVSIQAQVINLLENLQEQFKLTYLFIAHDLSVVKHISDRVAVMYLGKIVELSATLNLYDNPQHPYTEALLSAVPIPDPTLKKQRIVLEGDVPSPFKPPTGCRFHPRCKYSKSVCSQEEPELIDIGNEHYVACHLKIKKMV